jgi:hypothetical protein
MQLLRNNCRYRANVIHRQPESRVDTGFQRVALVAANGRAKSESLQRCKGPIKILGGLRYLNCSLIYESKGTELQPYRDELCTYIDRAWSRR